MRRWRCKVLLKVILRRIWRSLPSKKQLAETRVTYTPRGNQKTRAESVPNGRETGILGLRWWYPANLSTDSQSSTWEKLDLKIYPATPEKTETAKKPKRLNPRRRVNYRINRQPRVKQDACTQWMNMNREYDHAPCGHALLPFFLPPPSLGMR